MAGETAFRVPEITASPSPEEAVYPITEVSHEVSELPPSLYVESHQVPLLLELIGGTSAYDHFDMHPLTNESDRYISEECSRRGLENTKESYQKVLNEVLDKLALPEGTDVYATMEKIVRYLRIQHKLYTALRDKEELMQADPLTLSAAKLKIYLDRGYATK